MKNFTRRQSLGLLAGGASLPFAPRIARARTSDIKIGIQFGLPYLGFIVADAMDLFNKHAADRGIGSTFSMTRISGPTAMTEGLLSKNLHITAQGMLSLLIGYTKSKGIYDLGGISAYWKGTYTVYTNVPDVKSIADIKPEHKIAVPGPTSSQSLILRRAAMQIFGEDQAGRFDKQLVALPHPDAVAALTTGDTVQVYFATSPYNEVLSTNDSVHAIGTSEEYNPPGMTNGVVAGLKEFVDDNPEAISVFLAAMDEANAFIPENIEETARIYFEAVPANMSDEAKIEVIRNNAHEYTTIPNGVMETARFTNQLGFLDEVPDRWQDIFFAPINEGEGS
ncbi:MAG: ABC transporter substrate-binding protein [Jhaorihella sp.]